MLFKRYKNNPIISPDPKKKYEKKAVYNPCAIAHKNKIYLIYRADKKLKNSISRLFLAISKDGYNFKRYGKDPIIEPTLPEEKQGCEDSRITKIKDTYYLTYTAYDGKHPERNENIYTALATSKDLIHWKKQGIILKDIKAAAIFPKKINKEYIMVVGGKKIHIARSTDLINWDLDKKPILDIRRGKFDNKYVEVGPAPFEFKGRLILFFNTTNQDFAFHPSLAILDKNNPRKILYRADKPLMSPTEDYEIKGKIPNVIFGSGLVEFKGTYFYYYGGADTYICVATISKIELEKYLSSIIS